MNGHDDRAPDDCTPDDRTDVTGEMLGATGASIGGKWWLLAIAVTSGTNLLDFLAAAQPDAARTGLFAIAATVRIVAVFWLGYALIRRVAGVAPPGRPTLAFGRYALFMLGIVVVTVAAGLLAAMLTGSDARAIPTGIVTFLLVTLVSILLIRLFAWQAALAIGDRGFGPRRIWQLLSGASGRLVAAYLIIAVIAAIHAVLTRIAIASAHSTAILVLLAIVDGIVSATQLVLGAGLAVTAWRIARLRAGTLHDEAAA